MFIRLVRIKQKFIRIAYLYSKCTDCRIKPDIDQACTNVFLSVAEECIPRREVIIRCNCKIWFDSNIRRNYIRKRDQFRRKFLKFKFATPQTVFKQERNQVNTLMKKLKETKIILI